MQATGRPTDQIRRRQSAGLLMYRLLRGGPEVLLVHPGGPFWARKDLGSWSAPKGEFDPAEDPLDAARREFLEETGLKAEGPFLPLGQLRQPGGKTVHMWAFAGDCDPLELHSNTFSMEWPRGSGRIQSYPEVDRAAWYDLREARRRILPGQAPFLDSLARELGAAE